MSWAVARILVGLIFAYAGLTKLLEPAANFEAALLRYGVFSPQWIPGISRTLPWFEWIFGFFLIVGYAPRLTATLASLLSLAFLVTLSSSRLFVESGGADCGCFGHSALRLSVRQIFFVDLVNLVVLLRVACLKAFPGTVHSFLLKQGRKGDDIKEEAGRRK